MMKLSNNDESKSISSITDGSPNSLKKTFNKITVQNILNENKGSASNVASSNKSNTIIRKIKDFGMIGSVNNATGITLSIINARKYPLQENKNNCDTNQINNTPEPTCSVNTNTTYKKVKLTKEEKAVLRASEKSTKENSLAFAKVENSTKDLRNILKRQGSHVRKGLSLPQAVARRNARERNRVKQVNNGFAALRERIPDEVAKTFETHSNSRSSSKKISKVETLRMAVEYIRSLERLLGIDFSKENGTNQSQSSGDDSFILIKDEFDVLSPFDNEILDDAFIQCDPDIYLNNDKTTISNEQIQTTCNTTQCIDTLSNITVVNGLQYIRIPGTNTYQLLRLDTFTNPSYSLKNSNLEEESQILKVLVDANSMNSTRVVSSTLPPVSTNELLIDSPSTTINMISVMNNTKSIRNIPVITSALETTEDKHLNEEGTSSPRVNLLMAAMPKTQLIEVMSAAPSTLLSKMATSSSSLTLHTNTTASFHQPITTTTAINRQSSESSPASREQVDLKQKCATNQQLTQQQNNMHTEPTTYIKSHIINQNGYKDATKANVTLTHETSIIEEQQLQQPPQYLIHEQKQFVHSLSTSSLLDKHSASITTIENATCSNSDLSPFYNDDALENNQAFYTEDLTLKKEFENVMLDSTDDNVMLSGESLIEWWQAHAHKSDDATLV